MLVGVLLDVLLIQMVSWCNDLPSWALLRQRHRRGILSSCRALDGLEDEGNAHFEALHCLEDVGNAHYPAPDA